MFRINIVDKSLGLQVERIDVQVNSETEARDWIERQMLEWGIPAEKIDEAVRVEKLELLLEESTDK